jgi:hypothetical protein
LRAVDVRVCGRRRVAVVKRAPRRERPAPAADETGALPANCPLPPSPPAAGGHRGGDVATGRPAPEVGGGWGGAWGVHGGRGGSDGQGTFLPPWPWTVFSPNLLPMPRRPPPLLNPPPAATCRSPTYMRGTTSREGWACIRRARGWAIDYLGDEKAAQPKHTPGAAQSGPLPPTSEAAPNQRETAPRQISVHLGGSFGFYSGNVLELLEDVQVGFNTPQLGF